VFGTILDVNGSIGKLCYLLGHFDEKDMADIKKYRFLLNNSTLSVSTTIVQFLPKPSDTFLVGFV